MLTSPQGAGFEKDLNQLKWAVGEPATSAEDLAAKLTQLYDGLNGADFKKYNVQHVTGSARETLQAVFGLYLKLRDEIPGWQVKGYMTDEVQAALRNVFRILRYATDIFGELAIGHVRAGEEEVPHKAFTGPHLNTLVNPNFGTAADLSFQPGDVILVRGMAHNSAAIARIGDVDSQFSHVGLVYADEVGRRFVVEALIEDGSVINSLDHMLSHGNVRAVLFRHRDRGLARRASELIHAHVKKSLDGTIPHIPYDFTMKISGEKELFCSKLVRLAYDKASDGDYLMPTYATKMSMKNRDFVDRIGVTVSETFAPGDMELEPCFDLVAEWRDYRFTSKVRLQDMVMTKILAWMEERNYRFKQRFPIGLISFFGRLSAYLSRSAKNLIKDVIPVVPRNMRRKTIAAVIMLHKTAEPILQKMFVRENEEIASSGHQMHPRRVMDEVEQIREASGRRIGYLVRPLVGRR